MHFTKDEYIPNINKRYLVLFYERIDRFDRSSLAKRMANPHYTLNYNRMINREWISADRVTEDDINTFVLNVRLLVQDGDGISIRELAKNIYSAPNVPQNFRKQFVKDRKRWQEHIAQASAIGHPSEKTSRMENCLP